MRRPIGETAGSAYRGDRGKIAYDHSQSAHAPAGAQANVIQTVTFNGSLVAPVAKNIALSGIEDTDLRSYIEGLSFAITYNLGGADNDPLNPASFTFSDLPITLGDAGKTGYTFDGWFTEAEFTNEVTQVTTLGAKTLYAKMTVVDYAVTYNLDGGVNDPANPATFDVTDLPVALQDATKSGYTFEGWFTEAGFENEVTEISTIGNKTIYAKFVLIDYSVTYNLDGGTNDPLNPVTFDVTDLPIVLGDATKELFVFGGWYTEAEFTNEVEEITTIGNKTLYAKFTE